MTDKEKQLLIKDLCARLPYRVKGKFPFSPVTVEIIGHTIPYDGEVFYRSDGNYVDWERVENFKPYLRPMSSMTDVEKKTLNNILEYQYYSDDSCMCEASDWLNEHHFDYRRLIEKGLALEATEDMYKID